MLGSPSLFVVHRLEGKRDARRGPASPSVCGSDKGLWLWRMAWSGGRSARALTDERCDQCPTVTDVGRGCCRMSSRPAAVAFLLEKTPHGRGRVAGNERHHRAARVDLRHHRPCPRLPPGDRVPAHRVRGHAQLLQEDGLQPGHELGRARQLPLHPGGARALERLLAIAYLPIAYAVMLSFFKKTAFNPAMSWVGLANYRYILEEPELWNAFWRSRTCPSRTRSCSASSRRRPSTRP